MSYLRIGHFVTKAKNFQGHFVTKAFEIVHLWDGYAAEWHVGGEKSLISSHTCALGDASGDSPLKSWCALGDD